MYLNLKVDFASCLEQSYYESMGKEDTVRNEAFQWARAKVFNSNKTSVGRPLLLAAPPIVICLCTVLRSLARVQVMTPVEVALGLGVLGMVHAADAIPRDFF